MRAREEFFSTLCAAAGTLRRFDVRVRAAIGCALQQHEELFAVVLAFGSELVGFHGEDWCERAYPVA